MPTHVYQIPLRTRFRGITVREGVVLEGDAGWGEFSPFLDYSGDEIRPWWQAAREAAAGPPGQPDAAGAPRQAAAPSTPWTPPGLR